MTPHHYQATEIQAVHPVADKATKMTPYRAEEPKISEFERILKDLEDK